MIDFLYPCGKLILTAGARSWSKKFRGPGTVGNPRKIQSLAEAECNKEKPWGGGGGGGLGGGVIVSVPCVLMSISASYRVQLNFTTLNTFKPMT